KQPADLQPRWTARAPNQGQGPLVFDPGSETLFHGSPSPPSAFAALNLRTGEARPGFAGLSATPIVALFPLDGGRVGTYARDDSAVRVWTSKTGELASRLRLPSVPA